MNEQTKAEVRAAVREQYGNIARSDAGGSCCAPGSCGLGADASLALGYTAEDLAAVPEGAITALLRVAGFERVRVDVKEASREFIRDWLPGSGVENYVASANIEAIKPGGSVV